jgi:hypothetical protein
VLFEQGCQVLQLVGGECSFVFADHDRVEPTVRIGERGQQRGGLRTLPPAAAARAAGIEVLGDDQPVTGDEFAGAVPLPVPGRHPVLMLDGRHPAVERKPQTTLPPDARLRAGVRLAVEPSGHGIRGIVTLVVRHANISTKDLHGRVGQKVRCAG